MLKREEINVWSEISYLDEENFIWINIWESEQSRTDFMGIGLRQKIRIISK